MEKLQTNTKKTRSILRMPEWKDIAISFALFFVSRSGVLGGFPMTVPFFAALCDSSASYIYLPVLLLGSLSAGANALKYFLAALFFWLISEFRLRQPERLTNAIYCSGLILLCGLPDMLFSDNLIKSFLFLLIECFISAVMYYAFSNSKSFFKKYRNTKHHTKEEIISFILFLCAVLSGFSGIILPLGINISQLVGMYLILCVIMYMNLSASVCFAIAVGFVSSALSGEAILLMGIMAAGAIFSSLLKPYGKYGILTGFLSGTAVSMLYTADTYGIPLSIFSLFFSSTLFILTPPFMHNKMNTFFMNTFYPGCNENDLRIKNYVLKELKTISEAFKNLSNKLLATSDSRPYNSGAYSSALFDNVTSRVCSDCQYSDCCWRENLNETCKQMFSIIDIMEEKGFCDMTNIPVIFSQKCKTPEKFLSEFNHLYEMYKQDSLRKTEANIARDSVARQYLNISNIIKELHISLEHGFYFLEEAEDRIYKQCFNDKISVSDVTVIENAEHLPEVYVTPVHSISNERLKKTVSSAMNMPMRVFDEDGNSVRLIADSIFYPEFSVKQRIKDGQNISGDTAICFELPDNKFYFILCDGMGSGDDAFAESKMTAELLKEFIKSGINIETAISMINSSLALKTEREVFSTVDITEINLLTGEAHMYKVGGAQSYIKASNDFETFFSKSLPIGIIDDVNITHINKYLKGGDIIVMVSDGVSEADYGAIRGEWIKKIISYDNLPTEELSSTIINDALKKIFPNTPDDMTVIVIKLIKF